MACYCDYEMPSVLRSSKRCARKTYRCEECRGEIKPGEPYEYTWGIWGGDSGTFYVCERCHDARKWTEINVPCVCWSFGNTLKDCGMAVLEAQYRAPKETEGLLFGYFRKLVAIKQRGGRPPRNSSEFEFV